MTFVYENNIDFYEFLASLTQSVPAELQRVVTIPPRRLCTIAFVNLRLRNRRYLRKIKFSSVSIFLTITNSLIIH